MLLIDGLIPDSSLGGGHPRAVEIVRAVLDLGYAVTVFPMNHVVGRGPAIQHLADAGAEVFCGTLHREELCVEELLSRRADEYTVVILSRPEVMRAVEGFVRRYQPQARLVYDAEAIVARREALYRRVVLGVPLTSSEERGLLGKEIGLARRADAVLAVSQGERDAFADEGVHADIASHVVRPRPTQTRFGERNGLLFVGAMLTLPNPNEDSVLHFCSEAFPLVREKTGAKLFLVGPSNSRAVDALRSDAVDVVGPVGDVSPWYERARVFVAPTRYAAGIPLKVLEAAAHGIPCVVSPLLADQLGWENEGELLVGEPGPAFADCCVRLYSHEDLWEEVRMRALDRVTRDYGSDSFRAGLSRALGNPVAERGGT